MNNISIPKPNPSSANSVEQNNQIALIDNAEFASNLSSAQNVSNSIASTNSVLNLGHRSSFNKISFQRRFSEDAVISDVHNEKYASLKNDLKLKQAFLTTIDYAKEFIPSSRAIDHEDIFSRKAMIGDSFREAYYEKLEVEVNGKTL